MLSKLFRRRQFLLGPEYANFDGWNRYKVNNDFLITCHPDLEVSWIEKKNNRAILLGYFLDPLNPQNTNKDILEGFIEEPISTNSIISRLDLLCGRFVLIIATEENIWLFHDACGLRQVHYCIDNNNKAWCASQPNLLAERLGFEYDEDMVSFRNLPLFISGQDEFWFPCDLTPYKEIKYLLPNHYLDLRCGEVHRFWPKDSSFSDISPDKSINEVSKLLRNTIKAAALRFDLKMGISAGCDSRKSLAAAREVRERITFYTHTPIKGQEADIDIPSKLLPKLGLKHHIVDLQPMDEEFKKYFQINNTWPRERHGHIAYSFMKYFGTECVVLNSNISEYSGVWYWLPKSKINGRNLAMLRLLNHRKIIEEMEKWIRDARPACEAAGMNILVLYDLELRSRWVSQALAEYDIAFDTFNPFNNRHLFSLELSVDEKIRQGRSLYLPKKLIKKMWPEVLSEPINPEYGVINKFKNFILTRKFLFPITRNIRYLRQKRLFNKTIV
jgi:hypothetical protein